MPGATTRLLNPPRTVDPYYHQAERMASIEARLALLEQGDMPTLWEIGAGAPVPDFQNNYANYAPSTWAKAAFVKVANRVYLQGLVFSNLASAIGATGDIFTLPAGFRPASWHLFTTQGNAGLARIDVLDTGQVKNQSTSGYAAGATAGQSWYIALDGISFTIGT